MAILEKELIFILFLVTESAHDKRTRRNSKDGKWQYAICDSPKTLTGGDPQPKYLDIIDVYDNALAIDDDDIDENDEDCSIVTSESETRDLDDDDEEECDDDFGESAADLETSSSNTKTFYNNPEKYVVPLNFLVTNYSEIETEDLYMPRSNQT